MTRIQRHRLTYYVDSRLPVGVSLPPVVSWPHQTSTPTLDTYMADFTITAVPCLVVPLRPPVSMQWLLLNSVLVVSHLPPTPEAQQLTFHSPLRPQQQKYCWDLMTTPGKQWIRLEVELFKGYSDFCCNSWNISDQKIEGVPHVHAALFYFVENGSRKKRVFILELHKPVVPTRYRWLHFPFQPPRKP